jgi:hypothetical protein
MPHTDEYWRRYRSCTIKARHSTAVDAFWASLMIWKKKHGHAWVYPCGFCGGFHTGRIPGPVRDFIGELMKSEEFLKAEGFTVRPLELKVYDPALIH